MKKAAKIKIVIAGIVAGLISCLFLSPTIAIVIGLVVSAWLTLIVKDLCPGIWFLRWIGVLPAKK